MNDTDIINWIDKNAYDIFPICLDPLKTLGIGMTWSDGTGNKRLSVGADLRDCIRGAVAGESTT